VIGKDGGWCAPDMWSTFTLITIQQTIDHTVVSTTTSGLLLLLLLLFVFDGCRQLPGKVGCVTNAYEQNAPR
jgi:steroid 5-alpha reductase family enzyme